MGFGNRLYKFIFDRELANGLIGVTVGLLFCKYTKVLEEQKLFWYLAVSLIIISIFLLVVIRLNDKEENQK